MHYACAEQPHHHRWHGVNHGAIAVGVDLHRRGRDEILGIRVVSIFVFFGTMESSQIARQPATMAATNKSLARSNKTWMGWLSINDPPGSWRFPLLWWGRNGCCRLRIRRRARRVAMNQVSFLAAKSRVPWTRLLQWRADDRKTGYLCTLVLVSCGIVLAAVDLRDMVLLCNPRTTAFLGFLCAMVVCQNRQRLLGDRAGIPPPSMPEKWRSEWIRASRNGFPTRR